ncbi:MAG TPA: hypothetical protein PKD18_20015 [Saprospiraceae bacterium]|nr:hypothetical protein [Saprospiraceae bacterium]
MATKVFGLLLIAFGAYLFKIGLKYEDSDSGHLMNIKLIGSAILLFIGGIALLLTSKSLCEIFGIFC